MEVWCKLILFGIFTIGWLNTTEAQCSIGFGARVNGDQLLHTVKMSKGPLQVPQRIEFEVDYKVNPLLNEEITLVLLGGTDRGCTAIISNSVDKKQHFLGTVSSVSELKEFSITLSVYGILRYDSK